jgi:hypothetical protein
MIGNTPPAAILIILACTRQRGKVLAGGVGRIATPEPMDDRTERHPRARDIMAAIAPIQIFAIHSLLLADSLSPSGTTSDNVGVS